MDGFVFDKLSLEGSFVIRNFFSADNRGGFTKNFERDVYRENGIPFTLSESFYSVSMKNVIRGLHFQQHKPQAKLVSVAAGAVWDVIVDLRPQSSTLGQWEAAELSAENHKSLYIPKGFAHGFATLEDNTVMFYQCDGKYDKDTDTGIRYDDPEVGICWPVLDTAVHSERDLKLMDFHTYLKNPMTTE